ncbi:unnamed protein product, partial [marine sediment metagenome]
HGFTGLYLHDGTDEEKLHATAGQLYMEDQSGAPADVLIGPQDADEVAETATRKWAAESGATLDLTGLEIVTLLEALAAGNRLDHGAGLTGLGDDDHPQYALDTDLTTHAALTTGAHSFNKSARVYHTIVQAIPNETATTLAFNSEDWDTDAIHDNVTNNGRLTCKTAGVYLIIGTGVVETNFDGRRVIVFRLNDTSEILNVGFAQDAGGVAYLIGTVLWNMAVNDFVEMQVWQNSGVELDILDLPLPIFMMVRIA